MSEIQALHFIRPLWLLLLPLVPFLLENVGGEADLNLPDGIHPNAEGHRLIADNVWSVLAPLLPGG